MGEMLVVQLNRKVKGAVLAGQEDSLEFVEQNLLENAPVLDASQAIASEAGSEPAPVASTASPASGVSADELSKINEEFNAKIDQLEQKLQSFESGFAQSIDQKFAQLTGALQEQVQAAIEQAIAPFLNTASQVVGSFISERQRLLKESESEVVDLVFAVVTKVLSGEVSGQRDVQALVSRAISACPTQAGLKVHLNSEDYNILKASDGSMALLEEQSQSLEFICDDHIKVGGCLIESDYGNIDARVETQLEVLKQEMQESLKQQQDQAQGAEVDDLLSSNTPQELASEPQSSEVKTPAAGEDQATAEEPLPEQASEQSEQSDPDSEQPAEEDSQNPDQPSGEEGS